MDSALEIAIPVGHLGRHNALFRYKRGADRVRQGRFMWEMWLNVNPAVIRGGTVGPGPGLWQDKEDKWNTHGDVDYYAEFCAAANVTRVCPELVQVIWH